MYSVIIKGKMNTIPPSPKRWCRGCIVFPLPTESRMSEAAMRCWRWIEGWCVWGWIHLPLIELILNHAHHQISFFSSKKIYLYKEVLSVELYVKGIYKRMLHWEWWEEGEGRERVVGKRGKKKNEMMRIELEIRVDG